MKKIKFRVWDKLTDRMIYWDRITKLKMFHIFVDKDWIPMQYTGLKDKNGKEIYEGDIIGEINEWEEDGKINRIYKTIGIVKLGKYKDAENCLDREHYGFYIELFKEERGCGLRDPSNIITLSDAIDRDGFYIVGNIYQNKDLLQGRNN